MNLLSYRIFFICLTQVDFENPDFTRFPKFCEAKGMEAIVNSGDILYIPLYWWHHIESKQNDDYTVSLNFWYKVRVGVESKANLKVTQISELELLIY